MPPSKHARYAEPRERERKGEREGERGRGRGREGGRERRRAGEERWAAPTPTLACTRTPQTCSFRV
jgi:hypothetical protein